jgi:hypothetical protein
MFATHAGNCNDQSPEWVSNPEGCERVAGGRSEAQTTG